MAVIYFRAPIPGLLYI